MKNILKIGVTLLSVVPTFAFAAALANSSTAGATGLVEIAGDGNAGAGGVGWNNDDNTLFNEYDVEFTTAGEVYVGAMSNKAMAYARAVHLGGKGSVFMFTSAGYSGQCVEDLADVAAVVRETGGSLIAAVLNVTSGAFINTVALPADLDAGTSDRGYTLQATGCAEPGRVVES